MAVVMMVDGVEAATRSIKEITEEAIDEMVDRIIDQKLYDKQLEESDISLREIYRVRSILKASLKSIHHSRIEYPE
jgi:membrane-associated HD superfamily phosphohydrolase